MPLVISNSSTLIHLATIGRLALLKEFYGKITIPPAVWKEVVEEGKGRAGVTEVEEARQGGWIEVSSPTDELMLRLLKRDLDDGEAEVIALALEHQADLVLLDESEARRVAELYALPKTGIIGLLIRAKREEKIESLQNELDRLRSRAGFWIEERLYWQVLRSVGEGIETDG